MYSASAAFQSFFKNPTNSGKQKQKIYKDLQKHLPEILNLNTSDLQLLFFKLSPLLNLFVFESCFDNLHVKKMLTM